MASSQPNEIYYDILLLGRTGRGKSTTGNFLLEDGKGRLVEQDHDTVFEGEKESTSSKLAFAVGTGVESVTAACRLYSNEFTKVRVLDTPGFADSKQTKNVGVLKANLQVVRSILRCTGDNGLAFRRVLYFLPQRGPQERADGTLQEELKLIHGFLGNGIFKIMVIVVTFYKKSQVPHLDADEIKMTEQAFMLSLEAITDAEGEGVIDRCPPIVYLPFNDRNIVDKIKTAPVLCDRPLRIEIEQNRCIKCSAKLIYATTTRGELVVRVVINEGGSNKNVLSNRDSKCHPYFVHRFSTTTKAIGGVAHIATAGVFVAVGKFRGRKCWPGFTNDEEICVNCDQPPSSEACCKVTTLFKTQGAKKSIEVIHTNKE